MQEERGESMLNSFDFSAIEEMDPSLAEGHHVIYDREVPFELRIQDSGSGPQEVGTSNLSLQAKTTCFFIIFTILTKADSDRCKNPKNL